jgi:hypothetical protein
MQLRRFALGRNPLRRRVDRIEAVLLMGMVLLCLLVIPAALALGSSVRDHTEQSAAQERALTRTVRALTEESTANVDTATAGLAMTNVRVTWFDGTGTPHEGAADVETGMQPGTELTLWRHPDGTMTQHPPVPVDSLAAGIAAGLTLPFVAWPLLPWLFHLARRSLDQRRAEAWAREWRLVAPRWTRRWS